MNAKVKDPIRIVPGEISIHAVRGPRTQAILKENGFEVPSTYGDPALLLPLVDERFRLFSEEKTRQLTVIPNLNEIDRYRTHPDFVSPAQDPLTVAKIIASSEFVVGSSLHAIVLADALGVPNRWFRSSVENPFKYIDYFEGTLRDVPQPGETLDHAIRLGASEAYNASLESLIAAFPRDLFQN